MVDAAAALVDAVELRKKAQGAARRGGEVWSVYASRSSMLVVGVGVAVSRGEAGRVDLESGD